MGERLDWRDEIFEEREGVSCVETPETEGWGMV
jgi:hypothetical protein